MEGYVAAILIFIGITVCGYMLAGIFGLIALDCLCRHCCTTPPPAASDLVVEPMNPNRMTVNGIIDEKVFDKYVDDHI